VYLRAYFRWVSSFEGFGKGAFYSFACVCLGDFC
jgi:hypothetical protein